MFQEGIPLRAQIGEAIKYIKSLETKVKMAQEKKERLLEKKRTLSGCSSNASEAKGSLNPPKIEVRETDSAIQVILICGIDKNFIFCEILRILCELNVEVVNIYSTMKGDSVMHDVHCKVSIKETQLALILLGFFAPCCYSMLYAGWAISICCWQSE